MKRQLHEQKTRDKILKSSKRLFVEHGFQHTTIRQITKEAQINIGTLYHFYKDKQAIFHHFATEFFERVKKRVEEIVPPNDPCLFLGAEVTWHLHAILDNRQTAELYFTAYSSPNITSELLIRLSERYLQLFHPINDTFTLEDYAMRSRLISGYLQTVALEYMHGKEFELPSYSEKTVRMLLKLFSTPEWLVNESIDKLRDLEIGKYFKKPVAR